MHVYAPGEHSYQVVTFVARHASRGCAATPVQYPPSEIYHFVPLDERVETYQRAFTLTQDLTILATPEVQKLLAGQKTLTVSGTARLPGLRRQGVLRAGDGAAVVHAGAAAAAAAGPIAGAEIAARRAARQRANVST